MGILIFVVINENSIHSFIFLPKCRREICEIEIYQKIFWSGWIFFEEPNSKGIIVDHIQICRGETSCI
jgi:hypothetical protein